MTSVVVDEGFDRQGVHTRYIFQDDEMIVHQSIDMTSTIEEAKAIRNATEGERWGDFRHVMKLGPLELAELSMIRDQNERIKYINRLKYEKPDLVTFSKYLKR